MFLRLFSLCALLCVMPACANDVTVDCANASSTLEINHCAKLELDEAERELNQAYQKLVKQLSQPDTETDNYTELRQSLKDAQRAWIKFRELDCDTQFLLYGSGTIRTVAYLGCMRERAEQRTKELNHYIPYQGQP